MQRESVEEVGVAQMEAEIVALENASGFQEHVVFLPANRTLGDPLALELSVVQPSPFSMCPLQQGRRFSSRVLTGDWCAEGGSLAP